MNATSQATRARFILLMEKSKDQPLSPGEAAEVNSLFTQRPDLRRLMAESLLIDAELRHDPRLLEEMKQTPRSAETTRNIIPMFALGAAACLFLGLFVMQSLRPAPALAPAGVATLTQSTNTKWASSTLPTAQGSRLPTGTFELVEGLATVLFDSGAEIVLEAPATMEVLDAMNARLVSGTLVADVPPEAIGFTIDIKDAKIVDLGTRFGLSTSDDGRYLVQVIEGLVEVEHKGEEEIHRLTTGKSYDRGLLKSKLSPASGAAEPTRWQPDPTITQADGWQAVPTSFGQGKDSYVTSNPSHGSFGREPFFRVKHTTIQPNLGRVGYIGFDISGIDTSTLAEAELVLNIEPSDLGYASLVPDCEFTIYGLTAEMEDSWSETGLRWTNAPALDPTMEVRTRPDPAKAIPLGKFTIDRGVQRGTRSISGSALVDFIRADTNQMVTFIILRETDETAKAGLVHAFTSKENASNPPPLLRLKTGD